MRQFCKRLTIFEGPDGAGKSTAAQAYAKATGAAYVHFPALPHVSKGLGRIYVEAMLPALLGYQDVVFDRCWLSEVPYGLAFRNGADRLGEASCRMLERLAMRCGVVVVNCLPAWETVQANWLRRQADELLDTPEQLRVVYEQYQLQRTAMPGVTFDYTRDPDHLGSMLEAVRIMRLPSHHVNVRSAGNMNAPTILVGEGFGEVKEHDPFYQWPFASFSDQGCSQWLTDQLHQHGIGERALLWLNADQNLEVLHDHPGQLIALGSVAEAALYRLKLSAITVPHPQHHRRFGGTAAYPLLII